MAVQRNDRIIESTEEARAGTTGHNVRTVLTLSLLGAVVLFGLVFLYFFH